MRQAEAWTEMLDTMTEIVSGHSEAMRRVANVSGERSVEMTCQRGWHHAASCASF